MPLNKQKGDMYPFVTHTINFIRGRCPHACSYCYMKKYWNVLGKPKLIEKEFKTNLGEDRLIFVGSSIDMFAKEIPREWILKILDYCKKFNNWYLFQTKNPKRFWKFKTDFPKYSILATTIETNRPHLESNAPPVEARKKEIAFVSASGEVPILISIEPIMDFDMDVLVEWMKDINPELISIGADSKDSHLDEPDHKKIIKLIAHLSMVSKLVIKKNLTRI